jgi:FtsZ-interacting cell division protein YlmF
MRQCGRSAQEQDGQQDGQQSQQQQEGQQKEQQKAQQHARPSSGSAEHASAAADASRCLQALVKGDSTLQVALLENVHCLPALAAMLGQSQAAAAALALLQVLASSGTPDVQQLLVAEQPAVLQALLGMLQQDGQQQQEDGQQQQEDGQQQQEGQQQDAQQRPQQVTAAEHQRAAMAARAQEVLKLLRLLVKDNGRAQLAVAQHPGAVQVLVQC